VIISRVLPIVVLQRALFLKAGYLESGVIALVTKLAAGG
jgi:hypothetical protein